LFVGLWPPMFWLMGDSLKRRRVSAQAASRPVDESSALDELRRLKISYDPARAPEPGAKDVEGHWHVDSAATLIGREDPGPPEQGGTWELACHLVSQYEFADARILRGAYRQGSELLGRDMLLEARFFRLAFLRRRPDCRRDRRRTRHQWRPSASMGLVLPDSLGSWCFSRVAVQVVP
jgi:hypothetical protein